MSTRSTVTSLLHRTASTRRLHREQLPTLTVRPGSRDWWIHPRETSSSLFTWEHSTSVATRLTRWRRPSARRAPSCKRLTQPQASPATSLKWLRIRPFTWLPAPRSSRSLLPHLDPAQLRASLPSVSTSQHPRRSYYSVTTTLRSSGSVRRQELPRTLILVMSHMETRSPQTT